jgi:hypothetical protein
MVANITLIHNVHQRDPGLQVLIFGDAHAAGMATPHPGIGASGKFST